MKLKTLVSGVTALAVAATISLVSVPLAHADQTTPGSYNTVQSHRLLDTRRGFGAPMAAVAAHATLTFTATDASEGVVGAVALNVTAVSPTAPGSLTVFATGTTRPYASNLNFQAGQNVPNLVVTPVGQGGLNAGKVSIYNGSAGTVHLLADIHGYFAGGANTGEPGTFVPLPSHRFLDTRKGIGAPKARVAARSGLTLRVAGTSGIPADASAVVANVTAVQGNNRGYVTAYEGEPRPLASNLNYEMKQDRANLALVTVATDGTISLFNGGTFSTVDLVVDVTGYFVGGTPAADGAFIPSTAFRVFDSRNPGGAPAGALTTSKIQIFPPNDPTFAFFKAVVVNVTAVQPESAGYLTTYDGVGPLPSVSSSNFVPKHDVAGAVILPVATDGTISIYNGSYGNVDLVVDVSGFFYALPGSQPAGVTRAAAVPAKQRIDAALGAMKKFSATPHSTPFSTTHTK